MIKHAARSPEPDQLPRHLGQASAGPYLEFTFRHNRRHTPMAAFQTLLGLGAEHEPTTDRHITA
jgi:hypothetical protein